MGETVFNPLNMGFSLARGAVEPVKAFQRSHEALQQGQDPSVPDMAMMGMAGMGGSAFAGRNTLGSGGGHLIQKPDPVLPPQATFAKQQGGLAGQLSMKAQELGMSPAEVAAGLKDMKGFMQKLSKMESAAGKKKKATGVDKEFEEKAALVEDMVRMAKEGGGYENHVEHFKNFIHEPLEGVKKAHANVMFGLGYKPKPAPKKPVMFEYPNGSVATKVENPDSPYHGWYEVKKQGDGPNDSLYLNDQYVADQYAWGEMTMEEAFEKAGKSSPQSGTVVQSPSGSWFDATPLDGPKKSFINKKLAEGYANKDFMETAPGEGMWKAKDKETGNWEIFGEAKDAMNFHYNGYNKDKYLDFGDGPKLATPEQQTAISNILGGKPEYEPEYKTPRFTDDVARVARESVMEPETVRAYHGTNNEDFDKFKLPESSENAVFLADSPHVAEEYGQLIFPAEVKLENAAIVDMDALIKDRMKRAGVTDPQEVSSLADVGHEPGTFMANYSGTWMRPAIKAAREAGRDFLVIKNMRDMGGQQTQILALEPVGKVMPIGGKGEPLFAQGLPTDAMRQVLASADKGETVTLTDTAQLGINANGVVVMRGGADKYDNAPLEAGMPVLSPKGFEDAMQQGQELLMAVQEHVRQNPNTL